MISRAIEHNPSSGERQCSACRCVVDAPADIERHNLEVAATGERSYRGHRYYITPAARIVNDRLSHGEEVQALLRRNGLALR